jgi:hypothetical protein
MSRRFLAGTELRAVSYRAFEKGKLSESLPISVKILAAAEGHRENLRRVRRESPGG